MRSIRRIAGRPRAAKKHLNGIVQKFDFFQGLGGDKAKFAMNTAGALGAIKTLRNLGTYTTRQALQEAQRSPSVKELNRRLLENGKTPVTPKELVAFLGKKKRI